MSRKIVRIFGKFADYLNSEQNTESYINVIPFNNTDFKNKTISLICEVNSWTSTIDGPIDNFKKQVISTLKSNDIIIRSINVNVNHEMSFEIDVDTSSFNQTALSAMLRGGYV